MKILYCYCSLLNLVGQTFLLVQILYDSVWNYPVPNLKLFEEAGIVEKHDFKGGKARYEQSPDEHHDHLIDINSGDIIEFVDKEIEELQNKIATKLGYKLVDHKLELYGSKIKK